jgi:hypothetical protein
MSHVSYLDHSDIPSETRDAVAQAAVALADATIRYHYVRRTDPTSERAAYYALFHAQNLLSDLCNEASVSL